MYSWKPGKIFEKASGNPVMCKTFVFIKPVVYLTFSFKCTSNALMNYTLNFNVFENYSHFHTESVWMESIKKSWNITEFMWTLTIFYLFILKFYTGISICSKTVHIFTLKAFEWKTLKMKR